MRLRGLCPSLCGRGEWRPGGTVSGVLTRRALLLGSAVVAVAGCSPAPTITGGPTAPPEVPPLPEFPGAKEAQAQEFALQQTARSLAEHGLPSGKDLQQAHTARLTALRHPEPQLRPTTEPTPQPGFTPEPVPASDTPPPRDRHAAAQLMRTQLKATHAAHRERALEATGAAALLWASLSAACAAEPEALGDTRRPELVPTTPTLLPETTPAKCMGDLLAETHAVIYVMQTALGILGGNEARALETTLGRRRDVRARLTSELAAMDADAPAALPAYDVPTLRGDTAEARRLIAKVEARYARFVGPMIAAVEPMREYGTNLLADAHASSVRWGAALIVWPGWPDPVD